MEEKKLVNRKTKIFEKYLILILLATLFMSVAYAEVTDINLEVTGTVTAQMQDGLFISNISEGATTRSISQEVKYYKGTTLSTKVILSSDPTASLTYKISLRNNSATDYYFTGVEYDENAYDNDNITFLVDIEPYLTTVLANDTKEFNIQFKYKDGVTVSSSQELNSLLIFEFSNEFIKFKLSDKEFTAPNGITWEKYVQTEYNTDKLTIKNGLVYTSENRKVVLSGKDVKSTDVIKENSEYAELITFTISGTTYKAESGMTIGEWVLSDYITEPLEKNSNASTTNPVITYYEEDYYIVTSTSTVVDGSIVINNGDMFRLKDSTGSIHTSLPVPKITLNEQKIVLEIQSGGQATAQLNAITENVKGKLIWTVEPQNSGITLSGEGNTRTITATQEIENAKIIVSYGDISTTCNVTVVISEMS